MLYIVVVALINIMKEPGLGIRASAVFEPQGNQLFTIFKKVKILNLTKIWQFLFFKKISKHKDGVKFVV